MQLLYINQSQRNKKLLLWLIHESDQLLNKHMNQLSCNFLRCVLAVARSNNDRVFNRILEHDIAVNACLIYFSRTKRTSFYLLNDLFLVPLKKTAFAERFLATCQIKIGHVLLIWTNHADIFAFFWDSETKNRQDSQSSSLVLSHTFVCFNPTKFLHNDDSKIHFIEKYN